MAKTVLFSNPKRRRTAKRRKNPSPAQKRARAAFAAASRARSSASRPARAANPAPRRRRRAARRSNPLVAYRSRSKRRTNPISGASIVALVKRGAIQGAGAVAMDIGYAQIAKFLPATMRVVPGQVGVGNAVKMVLTAFIGKALSKHTKGLSVDAAVGALTVQARDVVIGFLPPTLTQSLSYGVAAPTVQMNNRTKLSAYIPGRGPMIGRQQVGAYLPNTSMMLNGVPSARAREGNIR